MAVAPHAALAERALQLRMNKFGVEMPDFQRYNISVWHVSIDGREQLFDAGNLPARVLDNRFGKGGTSVGFHSEALIAEELRVLSTKGHKVDVHQIYTERPPCATSCAPALDQHFPHTPVFHSVHRGEETKVEKLMEAYGITVP